MTKEKWVVWGKRADFSAIAQKHGIDQVTARILVNKGICDDADIDLYLNGGIEELIDPHLLKDADRLVDILCAKINQKEKIRIIGDYDIDGVMSSYILKSALERLQANVDVVIPHRVKDGYGLNEKLIADAAEQKVDTILTCDNGIAALQEIALAKSLGLTVLVTDHHEIPYEIQNEVKVEKLSEADAVVNPHQKACPYPNKNLCGAAVAWKIVCILFERYELPKSCAWTYLENVAFATVGDIVSLTGENRILVKEGLKRIRNTQNLGMQALIAQCKIDVSHISAYHFGFVLGPCVNASGRLETAQKALELFLSKDEKQANLLAGELYFLNEERKQMTQQAVELAKQVCEEKEYAKDHVLVLYLPEVHESIAGIVAGKIRECYYKPTFVLTKGETGVKGSGRSTEKYSMYEELCKCEDLLIKFGGHPMAAGLSLDEACVDELRKRLNEQCTLTVEDEIPVIYIDVPMPMDYVTRDLIAEFDRLAPFGKDNERPVFAEKNLHIQNMRIIGKNQNVVKLTMYGASGQPQSCVLFWDAEGFIDYLRAQFGNDEVERALHGMQNHIQLSIIYKPSINTYRGEETLQFEIQNYC